jgi:DNA-binding transcriptional LysR family regulator
MDSEALATFLAVYHAGGISKAATRLRRSQPAISRRVALLEQQLNAPLFDRLGGGFALSEAGRILLPFAERTVAALKDANEAMTSFHKAESGSVSVAVVGTLAESKLTAVLKRFQGDTPGADVTLRTASSAEVSALVRRGEVTIGLRYLSDPSPDIENRELKPEALVVACGGDHRLAGRRVRSIAALRNERWLAFPRRPGRLDDAEAFIAAHFMTLRIVDVAITPVDSLTAHKRLVESGYGIALLPESAIRDERIRGSIAVISVGDLKAKNPVMLVTRRNGYLSPASRRFITYVTKEF